MNNSALTQGKTMATPKKPLGKPKYESTIQYRHYTQSSDSFFKWDIPYAEEWNKGRFNMLDHEDFTQVLPMAAPVMGFINKKCWWYFVEYYEIWGGWNNFITRTRGFQGFTNLNQYPVTNSEIINETPYITNGTLYAWLKRNAKEVTDATEAYDWVESTTHKKYRLYSRGRYIYKLLMELGYDVVMTPRNEYNYCALPLMAFFRVITDNLVSKDWNLTLNYYSYIIAWKTIIQRFEITSTAINTMELALFAQTYNDDIFMNGFVNPNGPNDQEIGLSEIVIPDINNPLTKNNPNNGDTVVSSENDNFNNNNRTPVIRSLKDTYLQYVSQYTLNMLKATDNYIKKQQYTGTRYWDRLLAEFGIESDQHVTHFEIIKDVNQLPINTVTATAETADAALGDFGANATMMNHHKFDYEFKNYGILMCIQTVTPEVAYMHGTKKMCMRRTPLDYFTPQYDGKGTQPVSAAEIYNQLLDESTETNQDILDTLKNVQERIFEFAPMYYDYKTKVNRIYGDFLMFPEYYSGWHLGRTIDNGSFTVGNDGLNVKLTPSLQMGLSDISILHDPTDQDLYKTSQFERIFKSRIEDNFIFWNNFVYEFSSDMKTLWEYEGLVDVDDETPIRM